MRLFLATTALAGTAVIATIVATPSHDVPSRPAIGPVVEQRGFALEEPAPVEAERDGAPQAAEPPLAFDLLRVEPDGSMLIAGRASPDAEVEIVSEGSVVGMAKAGKSGDFVYLHENAANRMKLRLRDGERLSGQVAVVEPSKTKGEALALITSANEATRILQTPLGGREALPVGVDAVEVEGEKIVVAGSAKPADVVRVYVDDEFVGETRTGADERFVLEGKHAVAPGRHTIRVDVLDRSETGVVARAAVPLLHSPSKTPGTLSDDPDALRTGTSIIIRRGDSLWRISRRAYGRGTRFTTIFEANRDQIVDPDRIFAGQVFRLPTAGKKTPDAG